MPSIVPLAFSVAFFPRHCRIENAETPLDAALRLHAGIARRQGCRFKDVSLSHYYRYGFVMEKSMTLSNGKNIRELREVAGMTQEKLAFMSKVDRRTVQRAEQSTRLQMETLSSLAAALNVPVSQIISSGGNGDAKGSSDIEDTTAKSLVVLNKIASGITLLNIVRDSYEGKISCEADPTPDNIKSLTSVVSTLEDLMPDPWRSHFNKPSFPLSERLRLAVEIGENLKILEKQGIAFYAGTYTAQAQVPSMEHDTGELYITTRTPFTLVTICVVIVASVDRGDRITVKANNIYVPPPPKPSNAETPERIPGQGDQEAEPFPF